MKVWLDAGLLDADDARVSVFDHGLTVGDGVFESAKVVDGVAFALSRHLHRLARSAAGLGLAVPAEGDLRAAVTATLEANAAELAAPQRLRITLTGGTGPLGSDRGDAEPTLLVALAPLRTWAATAKVVVVPWTRNERGATAGLKTTSYAENVVALAYAHAAGGSEALLANTVGQLCEGTGSNVFLVLDGQIVTPPLSSGCLAGVSRALVLEWTGALEHELSMADLARAEEVFLTSSTRDVQAVHAVDNRALSGAPGPRTAQVATVFAERATADVDP
ncbi:MAG TPA: aminotransferase class IV [Actinomycetes bacterium]|jgi:branched-chain amino acid aminotransferase|nr:aminotransferase class IV [Actinomycetes bacterium]